MIQAHKHLSVVVLIAALLLSGCSGHIDTLRKPKSSARIELKDDFESTRERNTPFCDETFVHRALKGFYYPEFEDDSGVYYRGKKGSVQFQALKVSCAEKLPFSKFDWGGIYIPNNPSSPAQLYSYGGVVPEGYVFPIPTSDDEIKDTDESTQSQGNKDNKFRGLLVETILRVERNSIQFSPDQAKDGSLRAAIHYSNTSSK